jgi:SAM-dependent methyltransferase
MAHGPGLNDYDVLVCACRRYPVIAGIPILKYGIIGSARQSSDEVIALIQAGKHTDALLCMILPRPPTPAHVMPAWGRVLPPIRGLGRLKTIAHRRGLRRWRQRIGTALAFPGEQVTTCDLLDIFYRRAGVSNPDRYNHFAFRFGQPRHLVALAFTSLIDEPQKPILEICCGFGHITRSLAAAAHGQPVIGLDRDFFALYIAKTRLAPDADYVYAEAHQPLPFPEDAFANVCCVDGLHYVANKAASVQELRRVLEPNGTLMFIASRNAHIEYEFAGEPLPPEGYEALVADMPHRLIADHEVLACYLQRRGPPLARAVPPQDLTAAPLLSVVASQRQEVFQDYGVFTDWPHALGDLRLNPLYVEAERDRLGNVQAQRVFPAPFYERDNAECKDYLPERIQIASQALQDLAEGRRTPAVDRLIEQYVVLGMPRQYY